MDIAEAAHTVLVVSAPGLGDGIQAIKAGVLEIADVHVVSKCDKQESGRTAADLKAMLKLGTSARERYGWDVPVVRTSAETGLGIDELLAGIDAHKVHLAESGEEALRRRRIIETRIVKAAGDLLHKRLTEGTALSDAVSDTVSGNTSPHQAALALLEKV